MKVYNKIDPKCATNESYLISFLWKMPFGIVKIEIVFSSLLKLYQNPCRFLSSISYLLINSFSIILSKYCPFSEIIVSWSYEKFDRSLKNDDL